MTYLDRTHTEAHRETGQPGQRDIEPPANHDVIVWTGLSERSGSLPSDVVAVHPAASDCEALRGGFLAQPVNALSSLAYVGAAVWLTASARRRRGRVTSDVATFASLLAAEGIGSLLFHGPGDAASHLLHDLALIGTSAAVASTDAALIAGLDPAAGMRPTLAVTAVAAGVLVVAPDTTNALAAVAGGAALAAACVAGWRVRPGRRWRLAAAACLGAGVLLDLLGRTGGPWCRPSSWWQPHAGWHLLTAGALALWGRAALVEAAAVLSRPPPAPAPPLPPAPA